jgi:hypothetical protein
MELYEVRLDKRYAGMSYKEASSLVYKYHKAVLIAIGYDVADGERGTFGSNQTIYFNPIGRILLGGEKAFLITKESIYAHRVGKFDFPNSTTNAADENIYWTIDRVRLHMNRPKNEPLISSMKPDDNHIVIGSAENFPFFKKETAFQLGNQTICKDFTIIPVQTNGIEDDGPRSSLSNLKNNGKGKRVEYIPGKTLSSDIENHVLFCTLSKAFPENASYFVAPFREVDPQTPIVFLSSTSPEEELWESISKFGNVFYIVGTPLLRKDLRRAGVQSASRTVVFPDPDKHNVIDRIADSCALLSLLNIQALSNGTDNFVTVEFIHDQNMKLIGNYDHPIREVASSEVTELQSQNIIPAFAGGHVFSQSMFHSILCRAYYEHNLLTVLKVVICNVDVFIPYGYS